MTNPGAKREPTFFWQGALIVLPVVLMAVIGWTAIIKDKAAVEQEARLRAGELAQTLADRLAQRLTETVGGAEAGAKAWLAAQRTPGQPGAGESWAAHHPEWQGLLASLRADGSLPVCLPVGASGAVTWPRDYAQPPPPPRWYLSLSGEQHQAWDALLRARLTRQPGAVPSAYTNFLKLIPPAAACSNAEFIRLSAELERATPAEAAERLVRFASVQGTVPAESGLPLDSVVLAEALRWAGRAERPAEAVGSLLPALVEAASLLTPELLRQVGNQFPQEAGIRTALERAWSEWARQEQARALVQAAHLAGLDFDQGATNSWIDAVGGRWFCSWNLNSGSGTNHTENSHRTGAAAKPAWGEVKFYPKTCLQKVFAEAARTCGVAVPAYFSVELALAGEPLGPGASEPALRVPQRVLGEGTGRFEAAPGGARAEFSVRIRLEQPARLFAQQAQRTRLFGGLILVSTLAALGGLLAAWRAFERQLRLNELKSNFVSSVSHELRAPIASVRLMAESLERGKIAEAPKQREYFRFIVQECRRLSGLIENVLDFSRIEQGRKLYEFEPTDVVALAEQTVKVMETYAAERQVRLTLTVAPEAAGLQAEADGKALQQALVNLIDNAVKHSPKGATVTVGLEGETHGRFKLWVADHGPGIPESEQEKIFERFYRLGTELRRETQGVGIGLSIVKHIVEAHSGRVLVRSRPGEGSRFTLELPLKVWNES